MMPPATAIAMTEPRSRSPMSFTQKRLSHFRTKPDHAQTRRDEPERLLFATVPSPPGHPFRSVPGAKLRAEARENRNRYRPRPNRRTEVPHYGFSVGSFPS